MKKLTKKKIKIVKIRGIIMVLCLLFVIGTSGWCSSVDLPEDNPIKTFVDTAQRFFLYQSPIDGSPTPAGDTAQCNRVMDTQSLVNSVMPMLIKPAQILIDHLILRQNFNDVLIFPQIFRKDIKSKYVDTKGRILTIKDNIDAFLSQIDEYTRRAFEVNYDILIDKKQFSSAYLLSKTYKKLDMTQADSWIDRIKAATTFEVKLYGKKSKALESYPELAAIEIEQAMRLINSFPEGDRLRLDLNERFESARQSFVRVTPSEEAILEATREVVEQLIS